MTEHIVAVYKTEADATAAARSLESLGIPPSAIRQYAEAVHAKVEPVEHTSAHTSGGGFWAWLFGDELMTETTRSMYTDDMYDRRVSSGNVVLSLTVDDTKIHETISALEAHNPVDIDEGSEEIAQPGAGMTPPGPGGRGGNADRSRRPARRGGFLSKWACRFRLVAGSGFRERDPSTGNGWQGRRSHPAFGRTA